MLELVGGHQVVLELVAEIDIDLVEAALAVAELLEVKVDVFSLRVLLVGLLLEIVEKTALHLLLVEEVVVFVDDTLVATAAIDRLIRGASFRYNAYPEEIDYSISRGLNQNQMERLLSLDFVRQGQNLFITGSAGTGKSFLATAIGYHACKNGIRTLYSNTSKLLSSLKVAKAKNTIETELKKIERCQLLILDDAFLVPLDAKERPILLEIIEDRHDRKSIVMASQLPVENWYDAIGDQAVADAVLDRIVHSSHRIELFGESIRKMKTKK